MLAKYPQEVKDRTVRIVLDRRDDYPTEWAAIAAITAKSGITRETVRRWVRQAEIDAGVRAGAFPRSPPNLNGCVPRTVS